MCVVLLMKQLRTGFANQCINDLSGRLLKFIGEHSHKYDLYNQTLLLIEIDFSRISPNYYD